MKNESELTPNADPKTRRAQLSALVDGQLAPAEAGDLLDALQADTGLRQSWQIYHLTGEVLRGRESHPARDPHAFVERLRAHLDVAAPVAAHPRVASGSPASLPARGQAANDRHWRLLAGLASLAAVIAVAWGLNEHLGQSQAREQLARQTQNPPAADPQAEGAGPMLRDARLDELLAAHKQLGSGNALQMPAGFLRNATLESGSGR